MSKSIMAQPFLFGARALAYGSHVAKYVREAVLVTEDENRAIALMPQIEVGLVTAL
jgi:hypothetical protein